MDYGLNKIFVEGLSDKLFLEFLLHKYFGIQDENLIVDVEGKDKLANQPLLFDKRRVEENAKNLIIFDTDTSKNEGGRKHKLEWLRNLESEINSKFEIFLLPFDDDREGILENLLEDCINKEFSFFNDCWNSMIGCISESKVKDLNIPAQKAMIYSKIDLFKKHRNNVWDYKSSTKYDYTDAGIWSIDTGENIELKKLVNFIEQNLFND